jgi:hypothetical protein
MEPNVRPTRLPPLREREIMPVRGKVAKTVERRCRAVRDDALLRNPVPGQNLRSELKPGRPESEMIGRRRPGQPVHAMCNSV